MALHYLYAAIVMIGLAGAFYLGYRYGSTVVQDVSKAASTVKKVL